MRRKLKTAVASVTVGCALGLGAQPASAHGDNPYATFACGSTRPHEEYVLDHGHIAAMGVYPSGTAFVRGSCQAHVEDKICFWVGESRSTGVNRVFSGYDCVIIR